MMVATLLQHLWQKKQQQKIINFHSINQMRHNSLTLNQNWPDSLWFPYVDNWYNPEYKVVQPVSLYYEVLYPIQH